MRSRSSRLGWWVVFTILGVLIVIAVVDRFVHRNDVRDCLSRGGRMVETDCPEPRRWCTSTGRSSSCAELPCKQRCLERPR
ncbi:MAG: hypothetical protein JNK64_10830 [Myxococcales bacterium]|nr:hypothetical protein [Myxococcales bacterium]